MITSPSKCNGVCVLCLHDSQEAHESTLQQVSPLLEEYEEKGACLGWGAGQLSFPPWGKVVCAFVVTREAGVGLEGKSGDYGSSMRQRGMVGA